MPDNDGSGHKAAAPAGESRLDPAGVMVYLNVLDRFETPAYERAWRFFRQIAAECPDYASFRGRCPLWSEAYGEIDRVLCTYETAAVLIRHGGLNENLFFEQIPRVIDVWAAGAPLGGGPARGLPCRAVPQCGVAGHADGGLGTWARRRLLVADAAAGRDDP